MAPPTPRHRRGAGTHAISALGGRLERWWARMRLWFRRHARENVVLAIVATIGAWVSRPLKRFRTRGKVISGAVAVAMLVITFALLSDSGGAGTQRVRAEEPPTTAGANRAVAPLLDTTPPPLLLDPALTDGLEVGTNHIVVSGLTDPHAQVVIAELEVMADGDGAFAADVPLLLGPNRIDVVATDETGNATGFAFNVVYVVTAPPPPPKQAPKRVVVTTTSIVPPPPTAGATTTARRDTTTAGDKPTTTQASTTVASTAGSTTTTSAGGMVFPTAPTTTQAATTTQATTTSDAPTTQATTTAPTTGAPTTTQDTTPDTTAAVPTSDPPPDTTG